MKNKIKYYKRDFDESLYNNTFQEFIGRKFSIYGESIGNSQPIVELRPHTKNLILIAKGKQSASILYLKFLTPSGDTEEYYIDNEYWFLAEQHD